MKVKYFIFKRGRSPMKLNDILSVLPIYQIQGTSSNFDIHNITMDDRKVTEGDLFVCIKGFTVDGHDFAYKAVERGASVIVSERPLSIDGALVVIVPDTVRALALIANKFFNYPTNSMTLVGITGTNGKTTTTYLLEKIFDQ